MNLLIPRIRLALLPAMLCYAALGAVFGGLYGIIHDQVTYSISPEYFTRLKFGQFSYADFGFPPRILVGEIGFLATWWVGFFAAWFLARTAIADLSPEAARRLMFRGFAIVFTSAFAAALLGAVLGKHRVANPDLSPWDAFQTELGIIDLPAFVRVAYIHNAGYLGGLIGLIAAICYVWRVKAKLRESPTGAS